MAHYEATVASLLPDGRAEIVIRPDRPDIPNAREIAGRVCHCATENSIVRTEALNLADASPGDWVSVSRRSSSVVKNVMALVGFPCAGSIAGGILETSMESGNLAIFVSAGALLGFLLGIWSYRRWSDENMPVIDSVIKPRDEVAAIFAARSGAEGKGPSGCQVGCDRCAPLL
ncbi:MAG: SoxR reducing system RseC family protein [Syntrophus sp. (in: bacteria)]|nr:SoxR reducing system RseC family protein [Syntrophus sp. (in: bacteria)]